MVAVLLAMIAVMMVAVPAMMIFIAAMLVVSAMPPRGVSTRQPEVEVGKDEEFIPEDVAPVGLTMPAARRDAGVYVDGMRRYGLQEMKNVQTNDFMGGVLRRAADVNAFKIDLVP